MAENLKQNSDFLSLLLLNDKTEKIQICAILETINSSQLHTICVILSNIIKDNSPLNNRQRNILKKNKHLIRRILNKKTSKIKKYNIISRNSYQVYNLLKLSTDLIKDILSKYVTH